MAKVTTRKETGKLVIDFTYHGVRCREQTALADTATTGAEIYLGKHCLEIRAVHGMDNEGVLNAETMWGPGAPPVPTRSASWTTRHTLRCRPRHVRVIEGRRRFGVAQDAHG
jgi:hypothetical protein